MPTLPTLDAHAHFRLARTSEELARAGAVLALTFTLGEAALVVGRREPYIAWGVGCHPGHVRAQKSFDAQQFRELAERTAIVGEIGLDGASRVPLEAQLRTFRQALEIVADFPRLASIHSRHATALVIEELRRTPVSVPVLHSWTGTAQETQEAVALGCYFSTHAAIASHSWFRATVPPERVLIESGCSPWIPPGTIPRGINWMEEFIAWQLRPAVEDPRRLGWRNLAAIIHRTGTLRLLPEPLAAIVAEASPDSAQA